MSSKGVTLISRKLSDIKRDGVPDLGAAEEKARVPNAVLVRG